MKRLNTVIVLTVFLAGVAKAQQASSTPFQPAPVAADNAALEQKVRDLEDRVVTLEGLVRQLQSQPAPGATAAAPAPSAPASQPAVPTEQGAAGALTAGNETVRLGGAGAAAAKALNPDISVIGDFIASGGHNPINPTPSFQMHESEVGLQAIVDPYARADFFISFGETGVNLEEGFITFTSLPAGLVAKVGKMRSAFGKVNTLHNHVLPWTDRPLVTDNLVGGEDGIDDVGFSVTRILPAPKNLFLEVTAEVFRGDSDGVFAPSQKRDVSLVGHLRGYHDITDDTNIDLGVSYARGHNDAGLGFGSNAFRTQLYGADATLRWKPLRRAIYHSFVSRSELVWSNREQPGSVQRAFGFYTSADYQLGRRWFIGGRYDRSGRAREASLTDSGFSTILTYWPSEFSQIR